MLSLIAVILTGICRSVPAGMSFIAIAGSKTDIGVFKEDSGNIGATPEISSFNQVFFSAFRAPQPPHSIGAVSREIK